MANKRGNDYVSYSCSVCGKTQSQVRKLIAGPGNLYICDECVELCAEIIEEEFDLDYFYDEYHYQDNYGKDVVFHTHRSCY